MAGDSLGSTTAQGRQFEDDVASLYQSLGYRLDRRILLGNKELDLLATRYVDGQGVVRLYVECKAYKANVGIDTVHPFVATVTALKAGNLITGGVLVSATDFSPEAKGSVADLASITLLSYPQLQRDVFNLEPRVRALVREYESASIYSSYISLDGQKGSWSHDLDGSNLGATVFDLGGRLVESILRRTHQHAFVLADYGAGKTTLLKYVQYRVAKNRLEDRSVPLPVLVELRNYYRTQDVAELVRRSLREQYAIDLDAKFVLDAIARGDLVLLLDAFDEMVERSNPERRLELFREFLPAINSPSATILTSRPSYLVSRDELDGFVQQITTIEAPLSPTPQPRNKKAERRYGRLQTLKNTLVNANDPYAPAADRRPEGVSLWWLRPLDEEKIAVYVRSKEAELRAAIGVGADTVLRFIAKVYDLRDLASRPLLLKLIIDTLLTGEIDVENVSTPFGPSALYEVYTTVHLDLDWRKGLSRRTIAREDRRSFAEALALRMHRDGRLEISLEEALSELSTSRARAAEENLTKLTMDELATDMLTCSFVTIDGYFRCRFIHKSFREFFVAHVIKNQLDGRVLDLLHDPLPREVMYFLGGFAPTEKNVESQLLSVYRKAPPHEVVVRRNAFTALLYATPVHGPRTATDLLVSDAKFRELRLERWKVRKVEWDHVEIEKFTLQGGSWDSVLFSRVAFQSMQVQGCRIDATIRNSDIGRVVTREDSSLAFVATDTAMGKVDCVGGTVSLTLETSSLGECSVLRARGEIHGIRSALAGVVSASGSVMTLAGPGAGGQASGMMIDRVEGVASAVALVGHCNVKEWELKKSVVDLTASLRLPELDELEPDCLVVGGFGVSPGFLSRTPCPIIGGTLVKSYSLVNVSKLRGILVAADDVASVYLTSPAQRKRTELRRVTDQCIVAEQGWYERAINGRELSAVGRLREVVAGQVSDWDVLHLIDEAKSQFAELLDRT